MPWPKSALLGPTADLAYTGLASTVREELAVAAGGARCEENASAELSRDLDLLELLNYKINALSGGEAIHVALASLAAQDVDELQIDIALEQLDQQWRRTILAMLAKGDGKIAEDVFVADNHLSAEEVRHFGSSVQFPLNGDHWRGVPGLDPSRVARHIDGPTPMPIAVDDVSFAYSRGAPLVLREVSLRLEPGQLYF